MQLGEKIKIINEHEQRALLEVYSPSTDPSLNEILNIPGASVFKGFVTGDEYTDTLKKADVVVHVESFDECNIRRTWISISTKIADYLGAGKCILAIGPEKLASISHISDCSCVVSDPGELYKRIDELIRSPQMREEYQEKARRKAIDLHSKKSCIIRFD